MDSNSNFNSTPKKTKNKTDSSMTCSILNVSNVLLSPPKPGSTRTKPTKYMFGITSPLQTSRPDCYLRPTIWVNTFIQVMHLHFIDNQKVNQPNSMSELMHFIFRIFFFLCFSHSFNLQSTSFTRYRRYRRCFASATASTSTLSQDTEDTEEDVLET